MALGNKDEHRREFRPQADGRHLKHEARNPKHEGNPKHQEMTILCLLFWRLVFAIFLRASCFGFRV